MGKSIFLLACLVIAAGSLPAQTRLIAHKSHSGSLANFELVLHHEPFASGSDNFGVVGDEALISEELDSLIRVNDSTTVMVKRPSAAFYRMANGIPERVSSVRDTVHHPPLQKKQTREAVKRTVIYGSGSYYTNNLDSVKLIGFDVEETPEKKKKNHLLPVSFNEPSGLPPALPSLSFFVVLCAVSLTTGWIYSRSGKMKQA